MTITATRAIEKICKAYNMQQASAAPSPATSGTNLHDDKEVKFPLRELVGSLLYVSVICRPDISWAVQKVARVASKPTAAGVGAAKRIVKYLKGTPNWGIHYSPRNESTFRETYEQFRAEALPNVVSFTDADFAGCEVTFKSTTGVVTYLRGTAVAWQAKRQTVITTSTCEAESCAIYESIKFNQQHGLPLPSQHQGVPVTLNDNSSAITLLKSDMTKMSRKAKHFMIRVAYAKQFWERVSHVSSELNKADGLTKPLTREILRNILITDGAFPEEEEDVYCCVAPVRLYD
jgi:hypothetical protein